MFLEGTVINGTIVLDGGGKLPEGARVAIALRDSNAPGPEKDPTLLGLLKFAGTLSDLPPDFASEHDHYIHGTPKRGQKKR